MKCIKCGKEFDKDKERGTFNKKYNNSPTYDEMGFGIKPVCLACMEKASNNMVQELLRA